MRGDYTIQLAIYDLMFNRRDQLIIEKEKEMSKNLTFTTKEGIKLALFDKDHQLQRPLNMRCMEEYDPHCFIIGPVVDRLHEFEKLGLEPDQLEEIVRRYRMYRLAMNSYYGGFTHTTLPKDIDEMHELPSEGPYHVFMNGVKDIRSMYPKIMFVGGRSNGRSLEAAKYVLEALKNCNYGVAPNPALPKIEDVRFNDPATIVFWADGTKTVVKAQPGETYDPEKGFAMAISKKALGNNHDYYIPFKKYLKKYCKNKKED